MPSRRAPTLLLLLRIAACLCVGLVVTGALAAWAKYDEENKAWSNPQAGGGAEISGNICVGWCYDETFRSAWFWWPSRPLTPPGRAPTWAVPVAVGQFETVTRAQSIAYGWPFRCLYENSIGGTRPNSRAMVYEQPTEVRIGDWSVLYRPLFLGLTLNILFYAAITALLWLSLSRSFEHTRRALRRHRGLCARCRYDLRGLTPDGATGVVTCPECGNQRPASPTRGGSAASGARGAGASQ